MSLKKRKILLSSTVVLALVAGGIALNISESNNANYIEEHLKERDIKTYYSFSGDIKAKNSKDVTISSSYTIDEILVKEGDIVKKGDTILKTTSGNKITANMDGMISDILVYKGVKYDQNTIVATITDTEALQVEIKIDEYDVNAIEINDEVDVYINALDKTVKGKVVNLSKNATVSNGISYFRGVVEIEDTKDILVGMSTEVKAVKDDVKNVKTISINAVEFDDDNQPYVYTKDSKGNKVEKSITIGANDSSCVEVKSGLKDTDTILSSNSSNIFNPFEMMQNGGK